MESGTEIEGIISGYALDPGLHTLYYQIEYKGTALADSIHLYVEDFDKGSLLLDRLVVDQDAVQPYDLRLDVDINGNNWVLSSEIPDNAIVNGDIDMRKLDPGTYSVYYTVTNNAGCQQQVKQQILVK